MHSYARRLQNEIRCGYAIFTLISMKIFSYPSKFESIIYFSSQVYTQFEQMLTRCCPLDFPQEVKLLENKQAHHGDLILSWGNVLFPGFEKLIHPQLSVGFPELFQLSQRTALQIKFGISMPYEPKGNEEFLCLLFTNLS